ncbi:MAG: hypothetical protein KME64_14275 [Scytonematopsis contorta HA4267-MV1]|jgi:hypothetical protein|nr:hypothetical protein [Scytonematopsis contorta HA4267-MV1]
MSILQQIKYHKSVAQLLALISISVPLLALNFGGNAIASTSVQKGSCPKNIGGRLINYFETKNFKIYICDKKQGYFYTGIDKISGKRTAPLPAETEEGTGYVVKSGNITYIVNGASLDIFRGKKLLQQDRVIKSI